MAKSAARQLLLFAAPVVLFAGAVFVSSGCGPLQEGDEATAAYASLLPGSADPQVTFPLWVSVDRTPQTIWPRLQLIASNSSQSKAYELSHEEKNSYSPLQIERSNTKLELELSPQPLGEPSDLGFSFAELDLEAVRRMSLYVDFFDDQLLPPQLTLVVYLEPHREVEAYSLTVPQHGEVGLPTYWLYNGLAQPIYVMNRVAVKKWLEPSTTSFSISSAIRGFHCLTGCGQVIAARQREQIKQHVDLFKHLPAGDFVVLMGYSLENTSDKRMKVFHDILPGSE